MAILTRDLIQQIIQPVLESIGMYSLAAEQLLAGTCAQESNMGSHLVQLGGPALGIFQMEPETHADIWLNYLRYHPATVDKIIQCTGVKLNIGQEPPLSDNLIYNLRYAAAMCRAHYARSAEPLPNAGDVQEMARYWKEYYNTPGGAGTTLDFIGNWNNYVAPYYSSIKVD